MEKSMLDLAFEYVSSKNKAVTFKQLWAYVAKQKGFDEETANNKVSQFYTTLLLDGRFVNLGDTKWDLRVRHTFDKVHIDMRDVYNEVETTDDDEEDIVEEKEYNQVFEEKPVEERQDFGQDPEEEEDTKTEDYNG